MKYEDYYQTLGVARDADAQTIKQAYRKLARKYHPDVSDEADAEDKFKTINEAYEVLKDPEKRAAYDELGANWQSGQDFRPPPGWEGFRADDGYAESTFSFDAFADLFGAAGGRSSPFGRADARTRVRNLDAHATLYLTLEQLVGGESVDVRLADPDSGGEKTLRVKVPQHLRDGGSFRLKGQGAVSNGRRGDLYVEVRFVPHPQFEVVGNDLHTVLALTPWEAAIGAKVPVATLNGEVVLTVPGGTLSGSELRLKNRGMPGDPPGHQIVKVYVQVPSTLNEKELELFQSLAEVSEFNPRRTEPQRRNM